MTRSKFFISMVALVALAAMLAAPASAERLTSRRSQGNNLGLTSGTGWGMPWTGSWRGSLQYPRGSGNNITNDGMTFGFGAYRDIDGDGVFEDTSGLNNFRSNMAALSSLEQRDLILSLGASMGSSGLQGEAAKAEYNRIWSSLDASEVAEWPPEGRIPRTWSGKPDIAAAGETQFFHSSDTFNDWGPESFPLGVYQGWTLRFLDFGESNNMVYVHNYVRNMSEYMPFNSSATFRDNFAAAGKPEGITWAGLVGAQNFRAMRYNGTRPGWALKQSKDLFCLYPITPEVGGWTPTPAPLLAFKMINPPEHNGEVMDLSSLHTYTSGSNTEFGFSDHLQMMVGYRWSVTYQVMVDRDTGLYNGQLNPWTGRPVLGAFPGRLEPSDQRYDQWIWAGMGTWQHYVSYGELHDVAPRDSLEFDFALMLPMPGLNSWVRPDLVEANMDDPMMQELLAPAEQYAEVAEVIINGGFQVPVAPTTPPLTIVPGDRQITLTWSDLPLQQPDPYYDFLQDNPALDPDGVYRQYDFEGFRVYRSFVGPSDSHSELLDDFNLSSGNVQFHYIDKLEDDDPYFRMRNGMKVWYAVVGYDSNVDPATGEAFSLPLEESGKTWNRPGEGIYQVIPRSEASEYREAELSSVAWAGTSDALPVESVPLAGSGGLITETPKFLEPINEITVDIVNNEKVTTEQTAYLAVTGMGPHGGLAGSRTVALTDASGNLVDPMAQKIMVNGRGGSYLKSLGFSGGMASDGIAYSVGFTIEQRSIRNPGMQIQLDLAGYSGADSVRFATFRWGEGRGDLVYSGAGTNVAYTRAGEFKITWGTSGGGLTCTVQDLTHNKAIPFSPYIDDENWGFIVDGATFADITADAGRKQGGPSNVLVPQSERSILLSETIPADNTEDFYLYVNGNAWRFIRVGTMPASGTVMTVIMAYGSWSEDTFNQVPEPIYPGDRWKIVINPMSMKAEDADLSRIKVVPNPYMASSFLDLSPTNRRIEFVNLPSNCTIRIYTLSGNLVNVLNHIGINRQGWGNYTDYDRLQAGTGEPIVYSGSDNHSGTEPWNLRNRFGQVVASGLYLYHVTDKRGKTFTGKFYVVN